MTDTFWSGYGNALGAIDGVAQGLTARRAGARLNENDYKGAANALYQGGNLQGGMALQSAARTQQEADAARQWEVAQRTARTLENVLAQNGDVVAEFDRLTPVYRQMGTSDEQIAGLRQSLAANPQGFLQAIKAAVPREYEFRDGGAGDVVRIDKSTGAADRVYDAPDRPIATQFGILLPPGAQGGMAAPNATAPVTGAAISGGPVYSPSSMVGITAQAESGNRERDSNGNLITSPAGAQGRMQVMPGTNRDPGYGVTPARDNSDAERTRVGEEYLAAMMRQYGGDPAKAWAAYNWGPGNLDRAIAQYGGDWLQYAPAETQNYVQSNLRALNAGQSPVEEMGSEAGPAPMQDLGGGWNLQQLETPADRRAAATAARQESRWAVEDARAARRDDREAVRDERNISGQTFTQENQLRNQFASNQAVKDMGAVQAQVGIIGNIAGRAARGEEVSAQDDLALIFAYMKMLDPGSVVREGEFANAQNTAGVPERVVNAYNNALRGTRLSDNQRSEFFQSATNVMNSYRTAYDAQVERARTLAESYGLDPNRVAPRAAPRRERTRTNAPGLPFNISEGQLQTRARIAGDPSQPVGSERNPRYMNPQDPRSTWSNARSGDYIVRPDGRLIRKP